MLYFREELDRMFLSFRTYNLITCCGSGWIDELGGSQPECSEGEDPGENSLVVKIYIVKNFDSKLGRIIVS